MRVRRIWPAAFLLLVPVLAGCGDDDPEGTDDASSSQTPTSEAPSDAVESTTIATPETSDAPPAPAGLPGPCDVVTVDDLARAYGVSFVQDGQGGGTSTQQDVEWTSKSCTFKAADLLEVKVKLTGPDDFKQGDFQCPQPSEIAAIVEPVDDIAGADEGWWKVSDSPPLEATLRACNESVLLEVDLEYEDGVDYEGDPRNQTIAVAELVLAALQG